MEDWSMRENKDSSVEFIDNMQLLWKLQSLDPLASTEEENDGTQTFPDFNQSSSTSDIPDDDDLVDKLFRESLAMQQEINQQSEAANNANTSTSDTCSSNNFNQDNSPSITDNSNSELLLLSSTNFIQHETTTPATVTRKRSRSPIENSSRQSFYSPIQLQQQSPINTFRQVSSPITSNNMSSASPIQSSAGSILAQFSTTATSTMNTPTNNNNTSLSASSTPTINNNSLPGPPQTLPHQSLPPSPLQQPSLQQSSLQQSSLQQSSLQQSPLQQQRSRLETANMDVMIQQKLQQERIQQERIQQERIQQERIQQERIQQERIQQERIQQEQHRIQERRQQEHVQQQERLKQEQLQQNRIQQEPPHQERFHHEQLYQEHHQRERLQQQMMQQEQQKKIQEGQLLLKRQQEMLQQQQQAQLKTIQEQNKRDQLMREQQQQQHNQHQQHQHQQLQHHQHMQHQQIRLQQTDSQQRMTEHQLPEQRDKLQQHHIQQQSHTTLQQHRSSAISTQSPAPVTQYIQSQPSQQPQQQLQQQKLPSIPPPKPVIPPRPQLRLHFAKNQNLDLLIPDDLKDPMKPDLDVPNLRRLTVATLRTLSVHVSVEDLPVVDIESPLTTDSQQVLPIAAMQLITTMVLGTSGDKDVSRTIGSQISNGDLVALQRMITAGLCSKNFVIHTILTEQTPSSSENNETKNVPEKVTCSPEDTTIDFSRVKYEPPHNVTRLFLRLYRFLLNMLLSTPDCWPFIQPVPDTAFLYHQEIKNPMDLHTIEKNMWRGKYTKFARFEKDIQLVWKNARAFHRSAGTIPKHADNLEKLFTKIVMDIKRQISNRGQQPPGAHAFKFDPTKALPEESDFSYPPLEQVFSETSTVYAISALSPLEPKARKPKGLTNEKLLYLQLNGPFFEAVERMKSDLEGNHLIVPRFYIAKNRTLLRQIRSQGVLAIFYNTKTIRVRGNSKTVRIETDMILAIPASELFDIDQLNECTDDFAPKGWIHLRPLRVVNRASFEVNETIERDYFKRMFATSKMATDDKSGHHNSVTKEMLKKITRQILGLPEKVKALSSSSSGLVSSTAATNPGAITGINSSMKQTSIMDHMSALKKENLAVSEATASELLGRASNTNRPTVLQQRMIKTKEEEAMEVDEGSDDEKINEATPKSTNTIELLEPKNEVSTIQRLGTREIEHDVWKKLFTVCGNKGIQIKNITDHGAINWNSPNSEGFFKRVYFFDDVVVQVFRQMTMYQRITEVACLMKLRNLPHMAQMKEVLFNDNGDVTGLSMERYQITLKQHTHVHSHHRLSAHQKYDVIHQMLICMKTIHEAGLAHRDLSEVNIMVNTVDGQLLQDGSEKVHLYLIDFGKAVFCEQTDVRDWFVDVPRAEWEYDGDVVPETKEELDSWCESLPWVKGKPDHGYRMYRSIQTLPKTRSDNQVLPWLIHPQAEDMYSIGVMIWKVFTDTEPWRGILDTDLQGLRYVAEDDYRIQRALEGEVHGELSRQLLLKCLKTRPQDRDTAKEILDWITQENVTEGLIGEWRMYSSDTRGARRAKTLYGFEDTDTLVLEEERKKPKKKSNQAGGGSKGRGRPRVNKD